MKTKRYEMDMCSGSVLKKMLAFSIPLMFSSILQLLFNAADIVVVGNFAGDNSLAAVGSTSSLINLLTNLFIGLSIGANVLTARFYGAKQEKDLKETVHTAIKLSIISGIILTIIGVVFAPIVLKWMKTPAEVRELAVVYLRIYFIGMTAVMVYNFGAAILRAMGDTKRPLYYLIVSGIVNVVLNLFLVIVVELGVAGVAIATAVSQCISAFLVIRCLVKESGPSHLDLKELKIKKEKLIKIVQIGLPAGFQGMLFSFANVFIQSTVNSFGPTIIAGNSAALNIEGFVYTGMNAFHQSTISFTGQNMGAGRKDRINKILVTALCCATAVGILLGGLALIFGEQLLGLYSKSPEVIEAGMVRLGVICKTYALCGLMDVTVGSLRGMGYSIMPMIVSLVGVCALRLAIIAVLFQMEKFHIIETVYYAYPISWGVTFVAHLSCYIAVRYKMNKDGEKYYG
ncbi:MAG: MATE family efflux transporter [Lachnospira sp.]|nr:MATE family efflux transporter [Lachnospira sp.]